MQRRTGFWVFFSGYQAGIGENNLVLGNFRSYFRDFSPYSTGFKILLHGNENQRTMFFDLLRVFRMKLVKKLSFWGYLDLIPEYSNSPE